jgi:glycosyltransferase involved in cell wall biosynthesis
MKIAVIGAKGLPPSQGGIEHYCAEVYPRMVATGHTVDLYARSSYSNSSPFKKESFEGVRVIPLPCPGSRGFDALTSSALGAVFATIAPYDIVHFHALGPSLFTWIPRIAARAKVIVTCHGLDWQRDKWGKFSSRSIQLGERAAVRYAHQIIVVSKELQRYFKETYDRETVYIPNGPAGYAASDPHFSYGKSLGLEQGKYIVYLGRLVPEKCPDLSIQAFRNLQPQGWKLVLVGGNSDTPSYTAALTEMAAGNPNIIFTGELRGSHLAESLRGAGLFILPSNLEGLPLAMLEAMSEGIPVVASNIPPHHQLVGERRGLLFQAANVESCVEQLEWAIQNPDRMRTMANNAQQYVRQNYDWEHIVADTINAYSDNLYLSPINHRKRLDCE